MDKHEAFKEYIQAIASGKPREEVVTAWNKYMLSLGQPEYQVKTL